MKTAIISISVFAIMMISILGSSAEAVAEGKPLKSDCVLSQPLNFNADPACMANDFQDYIRSYLLSYPGKDDPKDLWSDQEGLQLEFRRIKFILSRYAFNPDRDHTVSLSDLQKQKQELIRSVPSMIQNAPFQGSVEAFGKVLEPNFNIKIEF